MHDMTDAARRDAPEDARWTAQQFLEWVFDQEERYELVDGRIIRMMAGAKMRHNLAAGNINRALGAQLGDGPCVPFQSDMAVAVTPDQIRFPDVVVDCDVSDQDVFHAQKPVLVVEVLSDRTKHFDMADKVAEYRRVPSIRYIMLVETAHLAVELQSRTDDGEGDGWTSLRLEEPDGVFDLADLGVRLGMDDIYRRIDIQPRILELAPPNR